MSLKVILLQVLDLEDLDSKSLDKYQFVYLRYLTVYKGILRNPVHMGSSQIKHA